MILEEGDKVMTCLEAQSNIMAFIDRKLPDDKINDFVRHMKYCPNCSEELEIYYTLVVGMKQLDNNLVLSQNFKYDLDNELNRLESKVKKAKRFKISTFSIVFGLVIFLMFVVYNQILNKVYNIEQIMIKNEQGETYFYDCFSDFISMCDGDLIVYYNDIDKPVEKTFYEKVHFYNLLHVKPDKDMETEENLDE